MHLKSHFSAVGRDSFNSERYRGVILARTTRKQQPFALRPRGSFPATSPPNRALAEEASTRPVKEPTCEAVGIDSVVGPTFAPLEIKRHVDRWRATLRLKSIAPIARRRFELLVYLVFLAPRLTPSPFSYIFSRAIRASL